MNLPFCVFLCSLTWTVIVTAQNAPDPKIEESISKMDHPGQMTEAKLDELMQSLVAEYRKNPRKDAKLEDALARHGTRSIRHLMKAFQKADPESEASFFVGVRFTILKMGQPSSAALPMLLKIVRNDQLNPKLRDQAITAIGSVGTPAEKFFNELKELAKKDSEISERSVRNAILLSGTESANQLVADRMVVHNSDVNTIKMIGRLTRPGVEFAPRLTSLLRHSSNSEIRLQAIIALKNMGIKTIQKELEACLLEKWDWRIPFQASFTLAEIGDPAAIPALQKLSETHWFPIVRDAARDSVKRLTNPDKPIIKDRTRDSFPDSFKLVYRDHLSIQNDEATANTFTQYWNARKKTDSQYEMLSDLQKREKELVDKVLSREVVKHDPDFKHARCVSMSHEEALILGYHFGEWVGELVIRPDQGKSEQLWSENISGIEKWHGEILVIAGTSHHGLNQGFIHQLSKTESGWKLKPWFTLPGAPYRVFVTDKNELVIETEGGVVIFKTPQNFSYLSAKEKP